MILHVGIYTTTLEWFALMPQVTVFNNKLLYVGCVYTKHAPVSLYGVLLMRQKKTQFKQICKSTNSHQTWDNYYLQIYSQITTTADWLQNNQINVDSVDLNRAKYIPSQLEMHIYV